VWFLDYLSFTLPYRIPGTALFERVKGNGGVSVDDWEEPKNWSLIRHKLLYKTGFSEAELKLGIGKAHLQFYAGNFWVSVATTWLGALDGCGF
jgi:hypothetical protein